jgi:hypothetical protein
MSTKAELKTLIDTNLSSGQPITALLHRDMLKNNANNILDNMYSDELVDTELTETYFSIDTPGDVEFNFKILKQGRKVVVSGTIESNVTNLIQVGQFTDAQLQCPLGGNYFAVGYLSISGIAKGINIFNTASETRIKIMGGLPNGFTLNFQITYFTAS